jgi:hypothetical protein
MSKATKRKETTDPRSLYLHLGLREASRALSSVCVDLYSKVTHLILRRPGSRPTVVRSLPFTKGAVSNNRAEWESIGNCLGRNLML